MRKGTAILLVMCMLLSCFGTMLTAYAAEGSSETSILTEDFSGNLSKWISQYDTNPAIDKNLSVLSAGTTSGVLWVWSATNFGFNFPNAITSGKLEISFKVDPNKLANYTDDSNERAFSFFVGGESLTASNVSSIATLSNKLGGMRIFKAASSAADAAEFRRGLSGDFDGAEAVAINGVTGYRTFKMIVDMDERTVNTYLEGSAWGSYNLPDSFVSANSLMFNNYSNFAAIYIDDVTVKHTGTAVQSAVSDVRWDFIVDSEGFYSADAATTINGVTDGVMKLTSSGGDPIIRVDNIQSSYAVSIKPGTDHKYMRIRLKNSTSGTEPLIMLIPSKADGTADWGNAYVKKFSITANDTEFKEYTVELPTPASGKPTEYGNVFRIDYVEDGVSGSMEIDYIVFTANETPPNDGRLTGITLKSSDGTADVDIAGFASNVEYYEVEVPESVYDNLSGTSSVGLSFNSELAAPKAIVKVKDLVSAKCVDITLTDADTSYMRNYRVVCKTKRAHVRDVRWDFVTDTEGFYEHPNTGAVINGVTDGVMKLSTTDNDPYIRVDYIKNDYGMSIKPGTGHKYMKIRLKNNSSYTTPSIMLVPEKADGSLDHNNKPAADWTNAYVIKFTITANDTEFKEYTVSLDNPAAGKPSEYGNVVRLDYIKNIVGGSMEVDYIVFSENATPPNDGRLTKVCFKSGTAGLSDVELEGFASNKDYYELDLYRDIYESLGSSSVALTFDSSLPTPNTTVTVKDLTTKKCVDIVAEDAESGYLRSYRIICRAVKRPAKATEIVIKSYNIKDKLLTFAGNLTNGEVQPISLMAHKSGDSKEPEKLFYHTVGLKSNGTVVATGINDDGQCDVDDWKDIVSVSTNDYRTIGLKSDGTVLATGLFEVEKWNLFE